MNHTYPLTGTYLYRYTYRDELRTRAESELLGAEARLAARARAASDADTAENEALVDEVPSRLGHLVEVGGFQHGPISGESLVVSFRESAVYSV